MKFGLQDYIQPKILPKMELNKKFILYSAGAFDWRNEGTFDTKSQICECLREDYGCEGTDEEILNDIQEFGEFKIEEYTYYPLAGQKTK